MLELISQMQPATVMAAIILVWIILLVAVGCAAKRAVTTAGDWLVGSYRIPVWMVSFWAAGAMVSAWAFFGLPGSIYAAGPFQHWTICMPMMSMFPIAVLLFGRDMRIYARKYGLMTLPDFIAASYGESKALRWAASLGIIIGCLFYATAQFKALGVLLGTLFSVPYMVGATIGIVVCAIYIIVGGFMAGAIVNTLNAFMMIVASFAAVVLCYSITGGFTTMYTTILEKFPTYPVELGSGLGGMGWYFAFSWLFLVTLGAMGQPHIITKIYGVKKPSSLWLWGLIAAIVAGITCPAYCYLGITMKYLTALGQAPDIMAVYRDPDMTIAYFTVFKLGPTMPALAGLLIAGVMSAAWSTIDGFIMVGGAAISRDVLFKCHYPKWTDKQQLNGLRLASVLVGAIIILMTYFPPEIVMWLAAIGWSQFAAALAPAMCFAVTWKGITKWGGVASVVGGFITSTALTLLFRVPKSILAPWGMGTLGFFKTFYLDSGMWGMVVGTILLIVVSLATKKERGPVYYEHWKIPQPK